jgi:hypothetical protein
MAVFSPAYAQKSYDVSKFEVVGIKLGMNYEAAKARALGRFMSDSSKVTAPIEKCRGLSAMQMGDKGECDTNNERNFLSADGKFRFSPMVGGSKLTLRANIIGYNPKGFASVAPGGIATATLSETEEGITVYFDEKEQVLSVSYRNSTDSMLTPKGVVAKYGVPSVDTSGVLKADNAIEEELFAQFAELIKPIANEMQWCAKPQKSGSGYSCNGSPGSTLLFNPKTRALHLQW